TRIEVVTEGVFTRMILDDPTLQSVSAVLFDEFHERSLDADLGLALAHDAQAGLREDLKILAMSATIDGARVAKLLGNAPVIESAGRAFPVQTRYLGRDPREPIERQVAAAAMRALQADKGSLLVFLPGAAEIRRTAALLEERIGDPAVEVHALFGALDFAEQDRAIAPPPAGKRKIVLATSIAETSLTIEGVRVVIDSGLARVPRYEPDVGLTRLETVRVSRAAADQRRGRAGRTEPGICYRLWDEPQTASLEPYAQPEILAADLSGFMLDLAHWGVGDPATLAFLDAPPQPAIDEARALLRELGAIDEAGRITEEGKLLRQLPLPPRLARMVVDAGREGAATLAAEIAVVLTERGLGGNDIDLRHRLDALRRDRSPRAQEARRMEQRWAAIGKPEHLLLAQRASSPLEGEGWRGGYAEDNGVSGLPPSRHASRADLPRKGGSKKDYSGEGEAGSLLALAYPDRLAKNRGAGTNAFLLANGRGASIDETSPLAREPFLVVAELAGKAGQSRILLAAPLSLAEIESRFADRIESRAEIYFDKPSASLRGRRSRRLGALALNEQAISIAANEEAAQILARGIQDIGIERLPWNRALNQWRDRVTFLRRAEGEEWPDVSDAALGRNLDWLTPFLLGKRALAELGADELGSALEALLPHALRRRLDQEAPTHFLAPTGSRVPIDYTEEGPRLSIRVQELFGVNTHPSIAKGGTPLLIELLSPAHRPVQVTRDLPAFWRGSYAAVKAEMRGRYPRHPWPDDPAAAAPTRRAKPRGS
ncbi:MAG TPA: ATP-dependent helicase C-terminal domain-containing protein, partial [Burkholderiales bacterium]|nr:ATP-dependent helicase C-terminal domain-containing protein [Burkholderiales bacterium]